MTFIVSVFLLSLGGIVSLFSLKHWEGNRARMLFPSLRMWADAQALALKEWAVRARTEANTLPPMLVQASHFLVHETALALAALARYSERQLHRLADFVSHKRGFQRRESHNEFLKRITNHPMRDSRQRAQEDVGEDKGLGEKENI